MDAYFKCNTLDIALAVTNNKALLMKKLLEL